MTSELGFLSSHMQWWDLDTEINLQLFFWRPLFLAEAYMMRFCFNHKMSTKKAHDPSFMFFYMWFLSFCPVARKESETFCGHKLWTHLNVSCTIGQKSFHMFFLRIQMSNNGPIEFITQLFMIWGLFERESHDNILYIIPWKDVEYINYLKQEW